MKVYRFEIDRVVTCDILTPVSNLIYRPAPDWWATDEKLMSSSEKMNSYVLLLLPTSRFWLIAREVCGNPILAYRDFYWL